MADYAHDAYALLQALGWESCHLMGVSFGGMVAQHLALARSQCFKRLVLACTSSGGAGGSSYPIHELDSMPPRKRAETMVSISDTRYDDQWRRQNPDFFEALVNMVEMGNAPDPIAETARKHHDAWERLGSLSVPTYVCGGRYDGIAPPENLRNLCEKIPDARLELFDGGHAFLHQDPRAYSHVIDFLKGS